MVRAFLGVFAFAYLLLPNVASAYSPGSWCSEVIGPPPGSLGVDPFYQKYLNANGIPVLSSASVSNTALRRACQITVVMLERRQDVRMEMMARGARFAIIGTGQVTTDIPEYRNLYAEYPGTDWNVRTRGLGGTVGRPVGLTSEENLLCLSRDVYRGEDISVHEFAHTIYNVGIAPRDPSFVLRTQLSYRWAVKYQLWAGTFAATHIDEYWAEGVQDWYNVNLQLIPGNGLHDYVNTRPELYDRDPDLHDLIGEVFSTSAVPACPTKDSPQLPSATGL